MTAEMFIGFAVGATSGAVIMAVILGPMVHDHYEKYMKMKALAFDFEEKWLDALEGNTDRRWMLRAEGAEDPYVMRGRPDLHTPTVDLTWADTNE